MWTILVYREDRKVEDRMELNLIDIIGLSEMRWEGQREFKVRDVTIMNQEEGRTD